MKKPIVMLLIVAALLLIPTAAIAYSTLMYDYATPVFGLAASPDGSLLVADAGAGIVQLRRGQGTLIAALPGVADIAPIRRGEMFAITGIGMEESIEDNAQKLFKVARGGVLEIGDLGAFEEAVNPDRGVIDSNPFDVEALSGRKALVADAGGNSLLVVDQLATIDWVATFPTELASTDHAKALVGCPTPPPGFEDICFLPPEIPAEAVPTSVAIGMDGAYYVGELKGFPAPTGMSRVWRIEPGTRHAECGTSPACTVVLDGLTSIVDITVAADGSLIVTEYDEATWLAVELGFVIPGLTLGGTVSSCDVSTATCTELAGGLPLPIATAFDKKGALFVAINNLVPGAADVIQLP